MLWVRGEWGTITDSERVNYGEADKAEAFILSPLGRIQRRGTLRTVKTHTHDPSAVVFLSPEEAIRGEC